LRHIGSFHPETNFYLPLSWWERVGERGEKTDFVGFFTLPPPPLGPVGPPIKGGGDRGDFPDEKN